MVPHVFIEGLDKECATEMILKTSTVFYFDQFIQ